MNRNLVPFTQFQTRELQNLHKNVTFRPDGVWRLTNTPKDGSAPAPSVRRALGQAAIQHVLTQADEHDAAHPDTPLTVRALGAAWSLSTCASVRGWLLQTTSLAYISPTIQASSMHADSPYDGGDLALVQGGTRVAAINQELGRIGRSLKTSGASNGQTIVGCTATGTHGSAVEVGSMQDTLRAVHVMMSGTDHAWVEPARAPVLADDRIRDAFGDDVRIVRDDDTFDAVIAGFGSFGVIESVVVEHEPLFLLTVRRRSQRFDEALQHVARTLDYEDRDIRDGEKPYHFDIILDPYDKRRMAFVTTMHKERAPAGYVYDIDRLPRSVIVADPSAVNWLAAGAAVAPGAMVKQASRLLRNQFPTSTEAKPLGTAPLGGTFRDVVMDTLGGSTEIGVPIERSADAVLLILDRLQAWKKKHKPYLGPVAMRFVKGSSALLAFTRFRYTCCIELPGANLPWLDDIYQDIWTSLEKEGIPFTLHWGQEHDLDRENVRTRWTSDRVDRWLSARQRLLSPGLQARYANPMLVHAGLA